MLVDRARAGSEDAFRDLVERCRVRIYRWALAATGDPDDADDVTQETVIRLYRRLDSFRGESHFQTWLYRVVRNAASGVMRKRRRHERKKERMALFDRVESESETPIARLVAREIRSVVRALFRELPERQRAVFDLVDLQGVAPMEAAQMLDMKPVTARAHLFRARRAIRERILAAHPELVEE